MSDEELNLAEEHLKNFIIEMNQLEKDIGEKFIKNNELMTDSIKDNMREKLIAIFNRYCTQKDRKHGSINNLSISIPPTYGINEKVIKKEIEKNKITLYTIGDDPLNCEYRYTLRKKAGSWLIDRKEMYDDYDQKWINDIL